MAGKTELPRVTIKAWLALWHLLDRNRVPHPPDFAKGTRADAPKTLRGLLQFLQQYDAEGDPPERESVATPGESTKKR